MRWTFYIFIKVYYKGKWWVKERGIVNLFDGFGRWLKTIRLFADKVEIS